MYRRQFIVTGVKGVLGTIGAIESLLPQISLADIISNVGLEDSSKNYSETEIDNLIFTTQRDIKNIEAFIESSRKKCSPLFNYIEKYGTIDKPKIYIKEDFSYNPVNYVPFKLVRAKKDIEYYTMLNQLYEDITILNICIGNVPMSNEERTNALSDLESLLDEQSLRGKTYQFKDEFTIKTVNDLRAFIETIAKSDIGKGHGQRDEFELEALEYNAIVKQLSTLNPNMLSDVSESEIVMIPFDKVMRRILDGYPQVYPKFIIYSDEKQYSLITKSSNFGAEHNALEDVIRTYCKPLRELMIDKAHEDGHVISRIDEMDNIMLGTGYQDVLKRYDMYVDRLRTIVENLRGLKSETDTNIIEQLNKDIRQNIKESDEELNAIDKEMRRLNSIKTPKNRLEYLDQLEEASAYLFQDIAITEYARDNPKLGKLLLQLRDWHTNNPHEKLHWAGYRFAEELKEIHNGDALSAFKELAYLRDEEKIKKFAEMLKPHNASYNEFWMITNTQAQQIKRMKSQTDKKISSVSSQLKKIVNLDESIRGIWIDKIKEYQKRVAGLYVGYVNYLYK